MIGKNPQIQLRGKLMTARKPRQGWARASRKIAKAGDDALVCSEFGNIGAEKLAWCGVSS
jgi:hypothetical protein